MEKMNPVKHESENKMMPTEQQIDSSAIDEGSSGMPLAAGGILKKGPWTSAEDAILVDYVKKNGEGNWNAVQKHSGLSRCGKSCRLRWANHLRPNLKKGAITPEEENLIIELHAQMGNKWARMATFLPGRTDNEIKNYWNTRIKRRLRAGLPLYPPDLDGSNENLQSQGANEFSNINNHHNEILQGNTYNSFPDIIFDNYKANQGTLSYLPPFPDGYGSRMLTQGFGSKSFDFAGNCIKRLRESETFLPGFHSAPPGGVLTFEQFSTGPPEKIQRGFGLAYPYDPDPSIKNLAPYGGAIPGSHALSNGNLSTSRPVPEKLELPSLQYTEMDLTSWTCPSSPLEAADSYIQSPPATLSVPSECVSPWNSGLLQDMVHGPHAIGSMKHQMSEKSSNSSILMPNNMVENSALNHGEAYWGEHNDPVSPLGLNADSIFSDTPPISVSSLDEFPPSKVTSGQIMANVEHVSTPSVGELDGPTRPDFLRHDVFLGSDWLDESSRGTKERSMFNDALTTFLRDDLCSEYKDMPPGAAIASSGTQGLKLESCSWNNMPRVCQMSEIP